VPFQWQPANPSFGLFGHTFTFLAIASSAASSWPPGQAMPRITDPDFGADVTNYKGARL
jgi:hypothetical protein